MYVQTYVHPSTKSFSDFSEIWCVDRVRCMIDDGMPCDPIQGQGCGGLKVVKMANFKIYLLHQYACNQNVNYEHPRQYLN